MVPNPHGTILLPRYHLAPPPTHQPILSLVGPILVCASACRAQGDFRSILSLYLWERSPALVSSDCLFHDQSPGSIAVVLCNVINPLTYSVA